MRAVDGYFAQTYTVEFLVPGDLDGVTFSPAIKAPSKTGDPQQLYRPDVPGNLGLIDVDYLVSQSGPDKRGARGNRYVAWFWLESPVPGAVGASLDVVDIVDGSVAVQKAIQDLSGLSTFYKDTGILVPQGSLLRISGYTNPGGVNIKVRLHIAYLTDAGLVAAQKTICACEPPPTPPADGNQFPMEFGVRQLAGAGANPRYLWPGAGRTIAQDLLIGEPMPVASEIQALYVHQQRPPAVSAETVTYTVLIDGVPTAATLTIPVTDGTVNAITGLSIPVAAGSSVAIETDRSGNHPTINDVLSNILFEAT